MPFRAECLGIGKSPANAKTDSGTLPPPQSPFWALLQIRSEAAGAQVVGAPLAAALLALDGWGGLAGWQWLFVAEGLPTIALGLWMRTSLVESPAKAKFLAPDEREWVQQRVARAWVRRLPCPATRLTLSNPWGWQRMFCCMGVSGGLRSAATMPEWCTVVQAPSPCSGPASALPEATWATCSLCEADMSIMAAARHGDHNAA